MGSNIKFLTNNFIENYANFYYSSQNASYPALNINDPFRSKVWRSNTGNFEVNFANDKLVINDGTDKTVSITRQSYSSGALLATELQTRLNAASSNFTVVYTSATNKFTISRTTSFSILWTNSTTSCADLFGYYDGADDTGGSSYEADEARICYPSEWFKFDFGLTRNPKAVCIIDNLEEKIKIQPSVTAKLQGAFSNSWNAPFEVDLPYNADIIAKIDMNGLLPSACRWARLYLPDLTNPLGYVQLGKIYIGDAFEIESSNVQREFMESAQDLTTSDRAIDGELYFDTRPTFSKFSSINIALCNKDDVDLIKSIWDQHRTYKPFFVSIDSDAVATNDISEWTKYVRFVGPPEYQTVTSKIWNVNFGLEELL